LENSRKKVGHLELTPRGQRKLSHDLLEEKKLDAIYEQLISEYEKWERENKRRFTNDSLSRRESKKLKREHKDFKKRFASLERKYTALLKKNKKEVRKEVKKSGQVNS